MEQACAAGFWELAWRLADTLGSFFQLRAHWDDWQHTHALALILRRLAVAHCRQARFGEAVDCLEQSLTLARATGTAAPKPMPSAPSATSAASRDASRRQPDSAYHTLDHAWEMEDKDLSAQDGA